MRKSLRIANQVAKAVALVIVLAFGVGIGIFMLAVISIAWAVSPLMGFSLLAVCLLLVRFMFYTN